MALEQIGQKLKVAREGQGLTLAQIYERTKIPINHLQAIDTGVTDDLPEPVYVAGFIKRYAECVGLNGQNLSDEYRKQATPERVGGTESSGWGSRSNVAQPVLMPAPQLQRARIDDRPPSFLKTLFYPACWIVLVLALITFLVKMQGNDNGGDDKTLVRSLPQSKFDKIQPANAPDAASQTGPTTTAPVATTAPNAAATGGATDAQLSITASQHVWVDIKAVSTGETLFIGNLEAGDRRDYKDPQGVRIVAGNGASVTIDMDGKTATMGPAGHRAEKVYLSKNPQAAATATVGADGTVKPGNILSTLGTSAVKPPVKRIKKPASDVSIMPKRRFRPAEDSSARSSSGDSAGGGRSVDVPYRYTEGRDSSE